MLNKKRGLNLSNSIYQQRGSGYGLQVNDGMLINNRPDGMTGIAQAAQVKKSIHRAEKIATIAEAYSLAERSEKDCGCGMM
jgi:hypothetical protein